jgi:signal transduction histidine kinase
MSFPVVRRAAAVAPFTADAAIAGLLAVVAELEVLTAADFPGSAPIVAATIPLMTLPLAWRRSRPMLAFAVVYAAYALQALLGGHAEQCIGVSIALLVAIYSVAAHSRRTRDAVAALVAGQSIAWLALALEGGRGLGDYAFSLLLGGGAWLGGYAVRSNRLAAASSERRAARAEAETEAERQRAVVEERARIAREMHDVVGHTISVVVVQAGAARQLVHVEPERSEELLRSVEATGREALDEIRRLLGLIRADEAASDTAPQPGLAQLDELFDRARHSGLDLTVEHDGALPHLGAGAGLVVYRIVQEAVTNAIRHGAGTASVALRRRPGILEIEVRNPTTGSADPAHGTGHGIIGMRERAELYGGSLEAGSASGGEFIICARLPVDEGSQ